jgi:hypothetical protein
LLSLGRLVGQVIVITAPNGDRLEVHLKEAGARRAVIGIVAQRTYRIDRLELYERDRRMGISFPEAHTPVADWIDPRPRYPELGVPCVVKCDDSTVRLATREETPEGPQWRDARRSLWSADHPTIIGWKHTHEASAGDLQRADRFENHVRAELDRKRRDRPS